MRTVLHISPDIEYVSGRTKSVFQYIKQLRDNNYNVILLTNGGKAVNVFEQLGIKILISTLKYPSYKPYDIYRWTKYLSSITSDYGVDIIHTHHRFFEFLAYLLKKRTQNKNLALITTVHSLHAKKNIFPRFPSEKIIAVSNCVKDNLMEIHKIPESKIQVIHNCIDVENKNLISKTDNEIPVLFSAGWFSREKGFDLILDALTKIKIRYKYTLIGTGPEEKMLLEKACEIGPDVMIKQPENDISGYYLNSDICIIPSRSEGLSYVALEAGKYCTAVIAANTGGIPEIVNDGKTGILFNANDSYDLAERIEMLINNTELRKQLALNLNRKVRDEFNENIFMEELSNIYNTL